MNGYRDASLGANRLVATTLRTAVLGIRIAGSFIRLRFESDTPIYDLGPETAAVAQGKPANLDRPDVGAVYVTFGDTADRRRPEQILRLMFKDHRRTK